MQKILIVEDEILSAITLEAFLKDEGFIVKHAPSGREALIQTRTFLPDILISDWKLKDEIDGIEVARELKKLNPKMHTIFCSGMSIDEMRIKAEGMDVFRYLGKPCGLEEMLGVVKEVCTLDNR